MFRMDEDKNEELDATIRQLSTDIKSAFRMAEAQLKSVNVEAGTPHAKAYANARKTMAQKLQVELTSFRKVQKQYLDRIKAKSQPHLLQPDGATGEEDDGSSAVSQLAMLDQVLICVARQAISHSHCCLDE